MIDDEEVREATRHAFYMFLQDVLEKYAPKRLKYLETKELVTFVYDWVEKNFD